MRHVPAQVTTFVRQHDEAPWRLRWLWLILARILWLAIFILTLVVFCANLLVGSYGLPVTILLVAVTSVWFAVSLVLFWLKSSNQVILLFSLLLVLTGGVLFPPIPVALVNYGAWWIPVWVLYILTAVMLSVGYMFPDGHFIPSFTLWLALGWIAVSFIPVPFLGAINHLSSWWLSPLYAVVRIAFYCSLALALVYRYLRKSTPIQRQQIKWLVFAATIIVGGASVENLLVHVLPSYFPALDLSIQIQQLVRALAIYLTPVLFPLAIGFAMLRHRLWDIDIIINRTLVYGSLTALLALIYFGLIFALQYLLRGIISQNNSVAIVISTLTIFVLIQPLRRRIQRIIDRRFYRSKYDAAKIIANFSSTLREEIDLDTLSKHLVAVIQETMQPAHVSLWLRKPEREVKHE